MLVYLIAFAAAQVSGTAEPTPAPNAALQAAPAKPAKKKRPKQDCTGDEPVVGSHIAIPCSQPDEYEQLRRAHQAESSLDGHFTSVGPDKIMSGPH